VRRANHHIAAALGPQRAARPHDPAPSIRLMVRFDFGLAMAGFMCLESEHGRTRSDGARRGALPGACPGRGRGGRDRSSGKSCCSSPGCGGRRASVTGRWVRCDRRRQSRNRAPPSHEAKASGVPSTRNRCSPPCRIYHKFRLPCNFSLP